MHNVLTKTGFSNWWNRVRIQSIRGEILEAMSQQLKWQFLRGMLFHVEPLGSARSPECGRQGTRHIARERGDQSGILLLLNSESRFKRLVSSTGFPPAQERQVRTSL